MGVSEKHQGFKKLLGDESNPTFGIAVGEASRALHIFTALDYGTDWNVAADTHPSIYIHSATTPATDYIKLYHDATNAYIDGVGATAVRLQIAGTSVIELTSGMAYARATFAEKTTQTALTNTDTVTAAQLLTKVLDGTPTAAATYTLPTAALLVAGMTNVAVSDSFYFIINNKSAGAYTITVAAGTGGTADGTLTVAQNVIRGFFVIITNVTGASEAYFVYGLAA